MELKRVIELDDRFGKQYKGKYVFSGISWGISNRIGAECTKINPVTRQSIVNLKELQARLLIATLIEKPKIITLEHLLDETSNGLPLALGELLMMFADSVNGYSAKDREEIKKLKQRCHLE